MAGTDYNKPRGNWRVAILVAVVMLVAITAAVIRIIDPDQAQNRTEPAAAARSESPPVTQADPLRKLPDSTAFFARTAVRELNTGAAVRWTDLRVQGRAKPAFRLCQALVRQLIWTDKGDDLANTTFARERARACKPSPLPRSLPGLTEVGGTWALVEGLSTDPVELAWRSRDPGDPAMAIELPLMKALLLTRNQTKAEEFGHPDGVTEVSMTRNTRHPSKRDCEEALAARRRDAEGTRVEVDRRWLDEAIRVHRDWVAETCPAEGTPGPCEVHRRILEMLVSRRDNPPKPAPVQASKCMAL